MSSREPMWYCHECNSEMRPLMVPDPVCASCHGSFVEKMENPADDPREFHAGLEADDLGPGMPGAGGMNTFMEALFHVLQERNDTAQRRTGSPSTSPRSSFQVRGETGTRTFTFGGPNTLGGIPHGRDPLQPPTMSEFLRPQRAQEGRERGNNIGAPLMAQYLAALMGGSPFGDLGADRGRMGDYVYSQEALDEIISQLMENSNSNRPVPATEEVVENLPREVLMDGSPLLEKDCAVCKEQFKTDVEDPAESVVVTLPCKHPFHEPCIMPWLKSSGTCPVCRHALVPQPDSHPTTPPAGTSNPPPPPSRSPPRHGPAGLFQTLFGYVGEGRPSSSRHASGDGRGGNGNSRSPSSGNNIPGAYDPHELD